MKRKEIEKEKVGLYFLQGWVFPCNLSPAILVEALIRNPCEVTCQAISQLMYLVWKAGRVEYADVPSGW